MALRQAAVVDHLWRRNCRGQTAWMDSHLRDLPSVLTLLAKRLATFILKRMVVPAFTPFMFVPSLASSSLAGLIGVGRDIARG